MKTFLIFLFHCSIVTHLVAQTVTLDKMITVKPIFVQNGSGSIAVQTSYSSDFALFQDATQRVFAQAGIRVVWETSSVYSDTTYYTMGIGNTSQLGSLATTLGHGQSVNTNTGTINLWFTGVSSNQLGISGQSDGVLRSGDTKALQGYATVAESIFNPSGFYSLTTIAHELGHVLGLDHNAVNVGSSSSNPTYTSTALVSGSTNLMAQGVGATTFNGIATTQVSGFGLLTQGQIDMMRLVPYVMTNTSGVTSYTYSNSAIPEPADFALVASAVAGLFVIGRRRSRSAVAGK